MRRPLNRRGRTGDPWIARGAEIGAGRCAKSVSAGGRGRPSRVGPPGQRQQVGWRRVRAGCCAAAAAGPRLGPRGERGRARASWVEGRPAQGEGKNSFFFINSFSYFLSCSKTETSTNKRIDQAKIYAAA